MFVCVIVLGGWVGLGWVLQELGNIDETGAPTDAEINAMGSIEVIDRN